MAPAWSLDGPWVPTWPLDGPWMAPGWSLDGPWMLPGCSQDVPRMVPGWSQDGPWMVPGWSLDGLWMAPGWSLDGPYTVPRWHHGWSLPRHLPLFPLQLLMFLPLPVLPLHSYSCGYTTTCSCIPNPMADLTSGGGHLTSDMHTCSGTHYYSKDPCGSYSHDALGHTHDIVFYITLDVNT